MKKAVLLLALASLCATSFAAERVRGYTRKDGTYVQPHYRSSPNSSVYDNYSTKGNVNPYTGKAGTVDPYQAQQRKSGYSIYNQPPVVAPVQE